ncbi:MAG: UbiD family decarboxylase [Planctomycetales bacterium]
MSSRGLPSFEIRSPSTTQGCAPRTQWLMAFDNLADFLTVLGEDGELHRVRCEVDPRLELSAIVNLVCKQPGGGPAILFEQVRGSRHPLLVNVLGSQKRLCRVLGVRSLLELQETMKGLLHPQASEGWVQKLKQLSMPAGSVPWQPQVVKTAACQQVVKVGRDVDLLELPAVQCWPRDATPQLLGAQIFTRSSETGTRFVETCPLEVRDRTTLGLHWNGTMEACRAFESHRARNVPMPVAISFGGDPLVSLLTTVPTPLRMDPLQFAGFLRGTSLELVRCRQLDMEVPAGAELVIEGYLDPAEPEEPAATHSQRDGYYSVPRSMPLLRVSAVTHRGSPLMTGMISGQPPTERTWRDLAAIQLMLPWLRERFPELGEVHLPLAGAGVNYCFVSLKKAYPYHAVRMMHALWAERLTMFTKFLVIVDDDVNVYDEDQVWGAIGAHVHPKRDLLFHDGPAAPEEHASPQESLAGRVGIDATRKWKEEGHARPWPDRLVMPDEVWELVNGRWGEYGFK